MTTREEKYYSLVAHSLTGESVRVEIVESLNNRLGNTFKRDGEFIIQIVKHSYAGLLNIFLHEVAHIKTHSRMFVDLKSLTLAKSRSISRMSEEEEGNIESEADALASTWLKYARENAWQYSGTETEKRLQALLLMR